MVQWLMRDCSCLGWPMQNWVWAIPTVLILYGAIMLVIRSHRTPTQL